MARGHPTQDAGGSASRRLHVYNGGFLTQTRVRRILELAGWQIRLGMPGDGEWVGVWGKSPTSGRGETVAARRDANILRVEDAFLRSIKTGRDGDPPLGLLLDESGVHFDPAPASDLEKLLGTHPLDDATLLNRAKSAIDRLKRLHLSKYNAHDPTIEPPEPGYVLVIDQTFQDASVTASKADRARFREMLVYAQEEHLDARVLIKTHPETLAGHRKGHFQEEDAKGRVSFYSEPVSNWRLLEGARAVYTVSSQFGFEAIFAGHKPRVFGCPFYAGWGLTQDDMDLPQRARTLSRAQLFAAAMILYPRWYDPYRDRLCALEDVIDILEARSRAFREDRRGHVAMGMRLWKRKPLQQVFGQETALAFDDVATSATAMDRAVLVWAGKETPELQGMCNAAGVTLRRVEDGFLRSKGLGAALIPPLSLVTDDLGIYYDPTRESRLERLVSASVSLPDDAVSRAERLIRQINSAGLSKYNLDRATLADLPPGHRILVPGQVEDDASIRLGTGEISTNLGLLQAARAANPDAVLIYKPHPDVEAGLRDGKIDPSGLADVVADAADPVALINEVDAVWTMTSLLGFEALLRGTPVTTLGAPFYAGWGLTTDLGNPPQRRTARPTLAQLVHAVLIDYPRYFDPVSGQACPVEVVVERLTSGDLPKPGPFNRSLSKLQGLLASFAPLWR